MSDNGSISNAMEPEIGAQSVSPSSEIVTNKQNQKNVENFSTANDDIKDSNLNDMKNNIPMDCDLTTLNVDDDNNSEKFKEINNQENDVNNQTMCDESIEETNDNNLRDDAMIPENQNNNISLNEKQTSSIVKKSNSITDDIFDWNLFIKRKEYNEIKFPSNSVQVFHSIDDLLRVGITSSSENKNSNKFNHKQDVENRGVENDIFIGKNKEEGSSMTINNDSENKYGGGGDIDDNSDNNSKISSTSSNTYKLKTIKMVPLEYHNRIKILFEMFEKIKSFCLTQTNHYQFLHLTQFLNDRYIV